jgi:D-beta-D-heptose 7-phosphate kinase/D-beta-D-heptose 1-phosphate adenosyltransferase
MSGNLKANLLSLGVASQNIEHVHQTAEIVKQRFIDERHETQIMRLDTEDEIFELIADKELFDKIKNVDAVIISDYDKGFLSYVAAAQICSCALENDVKIFVDTKKKDVSCYRDATFVKVNESEFSSIDLKSVTDNLVVTLGGRGAKYHGVVYDAEKRSVRDITGAGDVFLAALSINYMLTFDVAESIQFANTAAGLSVEKHGTAAISWKDL